MEERQARYDARNPSVASVRLQVNSIKSMGYSNDAPMMILVTTATIQTVFSHLLLGLIYYLKDKGIFFAGMGAIS